MRILITGVTGLLGNNLARIAYGRGIEVVGVCRSTKDNPAFEGISIDVHSVDLTDRDKMAGVFQHDFDAVVHCAAHIHIGWTCLDEGMKVNGQGTETVLALARQKGIKVIHVSTVNTLAIGRKDLVVDEETAGDGQIPCTYVVTKRASEDAAVRAAVEGQNVVIVHPGFMLGPWDWKPSSGRMVQGLNGFAPLAPSGGCSVCDPRDVANAILNAIDRGAAGRHYILGGQNLTYLDLWKKISAKLGKRGPFTYMRMPARILAGTIGDLFGRLTGREGDINSAAIAMSAQFHWYSSQRAIDELGYNPRSADESIGDSVEWLRSHGYLS